MVANKEELKANRKKVHAAFRQLRKTGLIARANFMCCQSCGHTALSQQAKKEKKVGWVFWHSQDEDSLKHDGTLSIAFGANRGSTLKVGQALVEELRKQGLTVQWNLSEDTRPSVVLALATSITAPAPSTQMKIPFGQARF